MTTSTGDDPEIGLDDSELLLAGCRAETATETPGEIPEGSRVAILDRRALEEGRRTAHERSYIGALTGESTGAETSTPVTREIVAVRLAVLEDVRTRALDDLAIIQGKIIGLREILYDRDDAEMNRFQT